MIERIGNVFAVPGKQEIHGVNRRERDMGGIRRGREWDDTAFDDTLGKKVDRMGLGKLWQAGEFFKSRCCHDGIARCRFIQDEFRDEDVIFCAPEVPPVLGRLLIGGNPRQPAAPRDVRSRAVNGPRHLVQEGCYHFHQMAALGEAACVDVGGGRGRRHSLFWLLPSQPHPAGSLCERDQTGAGAALV